MPNHYVLSIWAKSLGISYYKNTSKTMTKVIAILSCLYFPLQVLCMRCHICGNTELSSNKEFFAGKCDSEKDLGKHEDECPWDDNQYCLKLIITFGLEARRTTKFIESSFRDTSALNLIPEKQRDEMWKLLKKQDTIFVKEGILRGCAKFNDSFIGPPNCTITKQNGVEITTCLCHQSDYCNEANSMNYDVIGLFVIVFMATKIT